MMMILELRRWVAKRMICDFKRWGDRCSDGRCLGLSIGKKVFCDYFATAIVADIIIVSASSVCMCVCCPEPTCQRLEYREFYEDPATKCRTRVRVKHRRCQGSCGGTATGFCCLPRKIKTRRASTVYMISDLLCTAYHRVWGNCLPSNGMTFPESNTIALLSPHANRHAGDISFTVSFFLCLFVRKILCNGYLRRGLTQGDEIWQDSRSGWVAGHLIFWWTLAEELAPRPKSEKSW